MSRVTFEYQKNEFRCAPDSWVVLVDGRYVGFIENVKVNAGNMLDERWLVDAYVVFVPNGEQTFEVSEYGTARSTLVASKAYAREKALECARIDEKHLT